MNKFHLEQTATNSILNAMTSFVYYEAFAFLNSKYFVNKMCENVVKLYNSLGLFNNVSYHERLNIFFITDFNRSFMLVKFIYVQIIKITNCRVIVKVN